MSKKSYLEFIKENLSFSLDQEENVYISDKRIGNTRIIPLGSRFSDGLLRKLLREEGFKLSKDMFKELKADIESDALFLNKIIQPRVRVASDDDKVILDLGDPDCSRIVFHEGLYSIVNTGIDVPFISSSTTKAYCLPDKLAIIDFFPGLFNLSNEHSLLLLAWITYLLSHPKSEYVTYPILVLQAGQGAGKSFASKIIRELVDPRTVGIQRMPTSIEDLAVMAASSHLLVFDNVRGFTQNMADNLCQTSTGGTRTVRRLYSNNEEMVFNLHVPVILNGIHAFINQSDLAERCLSLSLPPIAREDRKTEKELEDGFKSSLPRLTAGLFTLTAKALSKLPVAQVTFPERMMDFCSWLAALELALPECNTRTYANIEVGSIQKFYSDNLKKATFDNLYENELGAAVLDYMHGLTHWSGSPTNLFNILSEYSSHEKTGSRHWPQTAISMSKKLKPLVTALASQGIFIEFTRGSTRKITIRNENQF
jgi:hypothetical protein